MMTCKELAELLMAYCDGDLPKEYCDLICQHVRLCSPCLNYMESYRITVKLTRSLPTAAMPQHFVDKLRAALEEKGEGRCGG
jgi:hypothetical protein